TSTDLGKRDRALFEVIYGSGLRVGEAVALNFEDLDLTNGWVRVFGKGSKERNVPCGAPACTALRDYFGSRLYQIRSQEGLIAKRPVFINFRGERLTSRSVARILAKH